MSSATASPILTFAQQSFRIGPEHRKIFPPLVKQFLDYLKLEKHFSDYTVKSYGADLIQFGQFLVGDIGQSHGTPQATPRQCRSTSSSPTASR